MEERKKFSLQKSLLVLVLTFIIFVSGLLIGGYGNSQKIDSLFNLNDQLKLDIQTVEVQYDLLDSVLCDIPNPLSLTDELQDVADKLSYMENVLGKNDEQVVQLKKQYFLLEIKHWLINKRKIEFCLINQSVNNSAILYFYSNAGDCPVCEKQGFALSYLRRVYPGINVYSFDGTMSESIVPTLKQIYNVSEVYPTLVINNDIYYEFLDSDRLIQIVSNQSSG